MFGCDEYELAADRRAEIGEGVVPLGECAYILERGRLFALKEGKLAFRHLPEGGGA